MVCLEDSWIRLLMELEKHTRQSLSSNFRVILSTISLFYSHRQLAHALLTHQKLCFLNSSCFLYIHAQTCPTYMLVMELVAGSLYKKLCCLLLLSWRKYELQGSRRLTEQVTLSASDTMKSDENGRVAYLFVLIQVAHKSL